MNEDNFQTKKYSAILELNNVMKIIFKNNPSEDTLTQLSVKLKLKIVI
jgi:hypothetical protein